MEVPGNTKENKIRSSFLLNKNAMNFENGAPTLKETQADLSARNPLMCSMNCSVIHINWLELPCKFRISFLQ
jgi:hypothetical protein